MPDRPVQSGRGEVASDILAALEAVPGPLTSLRRSNNNDVDEPTGGESFIAVIGDRQLQVKRILPGSMRLLTLAEEVALLERLAEIGLAPAPIAVCCRDGLLVTEYLADFQSMTIEELGRPKYIVALANLLRRLHGAVASLPVRTSRQIASEYVRALGGEAAIDRADRERAAELFELADFLSGWPESSVICHGDLVAANIMRPVEFQTPTAADIAATLRLIDFEYAQQAPPVLDLATLSVMNAFTPGQDESLLASYYAGDPQPFSYGDFAKVRRLVALLAHFWALARVGVSPGTERFLLGAGKRTI